MNQIESDTSTGPPPTPYSWMNYHHLYYFMVIAEVGTVSKAAQILRIGQPTLSAQLKQLESHFDVLLFERRKKRLILTEQGRVALDYAKNIFKLGSEMQEVLKDRISRSKPVLQLGALDSFPKQLILQIVRKAIKIAPCQISLLEGRSDEMLRELISHRIDLFLTNFLPLGNSGKGLIHQLISHGPVAIYGAPKFKALKKGFPQSLKKQPLVLPTYDSKLRYDIDHWAKTNGISLDILAESQDISVKKLMATHGLGLIAGAAHSVHKQVQSGQLIEIGILQGVFEDLYLLSSERKIPNPIAAQLLKHFESSAI